jgi:hypothetical protein
MEKSKNKKTTQEDSQSDIRSNHTGLIYWDDYIDNQTVSSDYLNKNFNIRYTRS